MIDKKHYYFELDANRGTLNHQLTASEETFILELCHKYDLKISHAMGIGTRWLEQYWTFNSSDAYTSQANAKAYILTKHGLPNIVCWVHEDTYFLSADARLKERSDGKYLHSKRMKDVIRKFDKRLTYLISKQHSNPLDTNEWINNSGLGRQLYQDVTKSDSLSGAYSRVSMSGASLHLLLNKAFENTIEAPSNVVDEWKNAYTEFNDTKEKQEASISYAIENLYKPFYLLGKAHMTIDNDRVTVFKVKFKEGSKSQIELLEEPITYMNLEQCPLHDKFRPQLMLWALNGKEIWDDKYRQPEWLIENVIIDGTATGRYDESTKTGNIAEGSSSDYEMLYTYLLDVD